MREDSSRYGNLVRDESSLNEAKVRKDVVIWRDEEKTPS